MPKKDIKAKKTKKHLDPSFQDEDFIVIKGAREHNLKNIDVKMPINSLTVITGLSGSGKSSLAFDTLYAEGQRRYVESLSAYARQFLGIMNKPDCDSIHGLSPAISIEQKSVSNNPRSTVGTITEIYDYFRLLFARVGIPHCPVCGKMLVRQSVEAIVDDIMKLKTGTKFLVLAPVVRDKKGEYKKFFEELYKEGYVRVLIDEEIHLLEDRNKIKLDKNKKHSISVVIDRLEMKKDILSRLTDDCEKASDVADGVILIRVGKEEKLYSQKAACVEHGVSVEELQPRMFSFNSPAGACESCHGLGIDMQFDPRLVIPDPSLSLAQGAIRPWQQLMDSWRRQLLEDIATHFKFDLWTPFEDLPKHIQDIILYGTEQSIKFKLESRDQTKSYQFEKPFEGVIPQLDRLYKQTESETRRYTLSRYMKETVCPVCTGQRLKPEILAVTVKGQSIAEVTSLSIEECYQFFDDISFGKTQEKVVGPIVREIRSRLKFLLDVGLDYLTLSRAAGTLSGGEAQRIRLATQIGSELRGVLYILDEPSIGLHQRDNQRLITTLKKLRDLKNTVVVVEHDSETIMAADHVIDLGPGAGVHGGKVIASGTPAEIMSDDNSLTGQYLSFKKVIPYNKQRRKAFDHLLISGAKANNLKGIDIRIPLGVLTCVTGVSGSGKSTLVEEVLYKGLKHTLGEGDDPKTYREMKGYGNISRVDIIDQSPIGRTPRSNPATYIGVFTPIRELYAMTPEAKARGYKVGRFSFNVPGGRCENCEGDGVIKIEMHFLPDVYVECEKCKGQRFNRETLSIKYKNKNIADILNMTVEEAFDFFLHIPRIRSKMQTLVDVGLGYIKLGQSSTTLSGGEAQRIKLTAELSKTVNAKTLYILDEPTTGLHLADIERLLQVLNKLVDKGASVLVIEHNLDVIKTADWIIDMGPEGGHKGGKIIAEGTPERIAKSSAWSFTGKFLKDVLK